MAVIDIKVPNIGDFAEVGVIEVLVQPGDSVAVEQSLITVESDKASMEIPSSHAGVVKELKVKVGDKVAEGSVVLTLEAAGCGSAPRRGGTQGMHLSKNQRQRPPPKRPASEQYTSIRQLRRQRRPRLRRARAGRRPRRLLGGVPRRRPGPESGAGRALRHAGRRVPERGLHPVQGAAACGGGDG